jgi:hypothetical protein
MLSTGNFVSGDAMCELNNDVQNCFGALLVDWVVRSNVGRRMNWQVVQGSQGKIFYHCFP